MQQLRRAQFGRKSERLDPEQLQLAIEDLETAVAAEDAEQDKTAPIEEAPKKKRKTNRGSLPAHLPRVHITLSRTDRVAGTNQSSCARDVSPSRDPTSWLSFQRTTRACQF
ncbi:transposase domain-containing protein [Bradyrhizobium algeriense]|uniref:transposase domain-containing protein n=1 Tax=Bradyrhizobium algeriense TaxID=634784 RepID=UPI003B847D35